MENDLNQYVKFNIKNVLKIEQLVTIHYITSRKDFLTPLDAHDFWEFVYVDCGRAELFLNHEMEELERKQFFLIPPNIEHMIHLPEAGISVFILSFVCNSVFLHRIKQLAISLDTKMEKLIEMLIIEIMNVFQADSPQEILFRQLNPRDNMPFGAEQMVCNYLEQLFISLLRQEMIGLNRKQRAVSSRSNYIIQQLLDYIALHLNDPLTVDLLVKRANYSRTYLSTMFKNCTGMSINEYVEKARIQKAQQLLSHENLSVTEIARQVGFSNLSYFIRRFHQHVGCSPMAYAHSIQSRIQQISESASDETT